MANQRTFGRRASSQLQRRFADARTVAAARSEKPALKEAPVEKHAPPPETVWPSRAEEFLDSEAVPERKYRIPWRQVSLMASLCFGIASLVLPASVNDNVQWLLYALMAASLYVGFSKRLRKVMD